MFDYRDGLVQFAFANEDVYVLDSLISLDLKGYLHYILKNRDYQHVCFLRGSRGHYTIQFPDRRSQEAYQRISWSMLDRLFKRDSGGYDPKPVLCSDDQVLRAMKKMDQTAFIFQIDSFDDCFREREEELAGLIRENDIKKNLILVLSGTTASESMPRFQDQEGIFMKKVQGTPLFPELSLAFGMTSGPEESCYTRLKTLLPDRCIFLNEMSGSPLVNLIWRVALNSPGLEDGLTEEDTCRIAAFIEAWYQSGKLQSRYRDCLSENELKKYSVLSGDLARSWSKIENAAREISPDMYMKNSRIILHVINDDTLNKQLGAVIFPRETGVCKEDDEQMMARFIRLRQSYSIPGGFIPDPALEEILSGVIGQMNRMIMRGDSETFYRICTMLEYAVESGYAYDEMDYNIWEWYSKIIEISVSIFDLDHQIESNRRELALWTHEFEEKRKEIGSMEDYAVESALTHEKAKAINLSKRIRTREQTLLEDTKTYHVFQNMLNQWEMAIRQKKELDMGEIRRSLNQCTLKMNEYHSRTEADLKNISLDVDLLPGSGLMAGGASVREEYEQTMDAYDLQKNDLLNIDI